MEIGKGGVNPKISVIIPVYNGLPFIQKTLQSVFDQEYAAHEIIVVNDGSKDKTQEFLEILRGKIIFKTIPNGGVSNARNEGIRLATGDYIAFLDADDVWFRNKLKVIAGYIQKYPEIGFFASDYVERIGYFKNRMKIHSSMVRQLDKVNFNEPLRCHPLKLLLRENFVGTPSTAVVKKGVAEQAGLFDPKCKIVEDLDFYLRAAMWTNFVLIRDILLYKKNHEANMSAQKIALYTGHKKVLENFSVSGKKFIEDRRFSGDMGRALADIDYLLGNQHFEEGNKKQAFCLYWEALGSSFSLPNILRITWTILKKSARLLTFDKLSRKNLSQIRK